MRLYRSCFFFFLILLNQSVSTHPANGIVEDQNGNVLFADVGRNIIWRIDTTGKTVPYITGVHSHDLWLDKFGQLHGEHIEYKAAEQTFYYSYWIKPHTDTLCWAYLPTKEEQRPLAYDNQQNGYLWRGDNNKRDHSELWVLAERKWKKLCGNKYGHCDGDSATALLDAVTDLFVTESGDVYIADLRSIRLWKDNKLTTLYREVDNNGLLKNRDDSQYNSVFGIYAHYDGSVLLANYGNQNVLKWTKDSGLTELYRSDSAWSPVGVTRRSHCDTECRVLILEGAYGTDDHLKVRVIDLSENGSKRVLGGN